MFPVKDCEAMQFHAEPEAWRQSADSHTVDNRIWAVKSDFCHAGGTQKTLWDDKQFGCAMRGVYCPVFKLGVIDGDANTLPVMVSRLSQCVDFKLDDNIFRPGLTQVYG